MKQPISSAAKKALYNVITVLSLGIILLTSVILLSRIREVSSQNRALSERANQLSVEIKQQTTINQKFLRCLVLTPQVPNRTVEERTAIVDKCVENSLQNDPAFKETK